MIGFRAFLFYRNNKGGLSDILRNACNLYLIRHISAGKPRFRISSSLLVQVATLYKRNEEGVPDCPDNTIWSREPVHISDNSCLHRLPLGYTILPCTTTIRWW